MRYVCIERYRGEFPVVLMCRVLEVTRSGFYAWRTREPSARARQDQRLRIEVRVIHRQASGCYGSPRIHQELRGRGERVSRKRIARLMRVEGLRGKKKRRFRVTTNSDHTYPVAPNLLDRKFAVEDVPARTGCGYRTSPTCPRVKDGCTWPSSWTLHRAWWWGGRWVRRWRPAWRSAR